MTVEMALAQSLNTYKYIPKGVYALKRDFNASTRLTAQHYLWKDALKFNIHPDIPTDGNQLRIADVATGNGIWLLDVARELSHPATFVGFDISLDQCPPSPWLPANTHLHTWNIFEEPPKEFQETFDIVHIRLITVAIKDNDPRPVLANLRKLLSKSIKFPGFSHHTHTIKQEPGGFLQWDEADSVDWTIKTVDSPCATDAVQRLFQQLCGSHDWKRDMVATLENNGFKNSKLHRVEYDITMARFWSDVYMSTWDEFAKVVVQKPDESSQLSQAAMDQVRDGSAISCPKLVWVAQKT
ncbi:umta methyltransferase family protein [Rutstroemia sp. NJR-2017a WRK4]|nr:umta methyltransferase family protein [Rutstroemia sp. NJR-2017a WRK4]